MFNFDNQLLKDYAQCQAAGIARHVFHLRSKSEKIAADIGNAYHRALEEHFRGQPKRTVVARFEDEYNKVIPPQEQPEEERFARANCIKIMERYCDVRPVSSMPFEPVEFEMVKGAAIDDSGQYVFWAKRDMLVRDKQSGTMMPLDHKTTGSLNQWWSSTFRMNSQMSGYCWITGRQYKPPVAQCYVNGLQISKLPDSLKKCPVHKVKYIECSMEHATFQLYRYDRSPEMLEKWRGDALLLAKQAEALAMLYSDIRALPYALRDGAFRDHCRFCEFKDWCRMDFNPQAAEQFCVYEVWQVWKEGTRVDV